jgi:hypothetical protein
MKVADLFGAGVPVCALDYGIGLGERVRHDDNGFLFSTGRQLADVLFDLSETFPHDQALLDRLRSDAGKSARPTWEEGWARGETGLARLRAVARDTSATLQSPDVHRGDPYRKFSTSIRSSTEESTRVKRIVLPSGDAASPAATSPRFRATVVDLPLAKSRN